MVGYPTISDSPLSIQPTFIMKPTVDNRYGAYVNVLFWAAIIVSQARYFSGNVYMLENVLVQKVTCFDMNEHRYDICMIMKFAKESQEGLETKVGLRAVLVGVEAALICLDSLRLSSCIRNSYVGSSTSVVKFSAERHADALLSCSRPSGEVGGITGGIKASRYQMHCRHYFGAESWSMISVVIACESICKLRGLLVLELSGYLETCQVHDLPIMQQLEPIREATPHLKQATHKVIENFMIKVTELLEASMATRRNERVPATGADEALERFLKFRPPEFYGEVEQEIKAEMFLILIDTDANKTRQFVKRLRVELQWALALLPPMGFTVAVQATTQTEMADQAVIQRKTTVGSATTPYKHPEQGPWKPRDSKRSCGEQRIGNEGQPTLTP
ncbi:hypothetical protein M9H77_23854 [Catharanthus roseus]|uniref:Uncharacterized protein n=1 Tax=Catharanthus roseus TaxID=4058 RepID=A0ACC0AYK5_CATRO|nr:hypothetical protein M9H77_23854 [Catharanthus roseus]